jgi:hypothetical protein
VFDINVIKADYRDDQDPRYSLVYQMTRLTRDKGALRNDDKLDALSMAVQYWVEHMSRDTEKAATEHKEALLDKELEKFMGQVLGAKPVSNTWFNI